MGFDGCPFPFDSFDRMDEKLDEIPLGLAQADNIALAGKLRHRLGGDFNKLPAGKLLDKLACML